MVDVNVTITNLLASDATTFASATSENHGQSGLLALDTGAFIWLGIDIPSIVTDSTKVVSATLKMKTGQAGNQNIILMRPTATWSEATITHATRPATIDGKTITMGSTAANVVKSFDITNEFKSFVNGSWANFGLAMRGSSASNRVTFFSGEMGAPDGAVLEIVYTTTDATAVVPVVTGSGLMGNATAITQKDKAIVASPMTASVMISDPKTSLRGTIVSDANLRSNGAVSDPGATVARLYKGAGNNDSYLLKWTTPSLTGNTLNKIVLTLRAEAGTFAQTQPIEVWSVSSNWTDGGTPSPTTIGSGSGTLIQTTSVPVVAGQDFQIELDSAFFNSLTGTNAIRLNIAVISGNDDVRISTQEGSKAPTMDYFVTSIVATPVTVNAPVATASANSVDPTVSTTKSVSTSATPALASASAVNPSVSGNIVVNVIADPALASATMPDATAVVPDRYVPAEAATANASIVDPSVIGGSSVIVVVDEAATATGLANDATVDFITNVSVLQTTATATGRAITPVVNGNDISFYDDPYYILARQTTDADDIWYRFKETDGATTVKDEVYDIITNLQHNDAVVVGNPNFVQGFGTHRAMAFDGVDDALIIPESSDPAWQPGSYEFYINTSVKTQPIANGSGYTDVGLGRPGFIGQYEIPRATDIGLIDGKVSIKNYLTSTPESVVGEMLGTVDIADGEWHQVVITNWWYPGVVEPNSVRNYEGVKDYVDGSGPQSGISIYVDGKLDQRKVFIYGQNQFATGLAAPDVIGRKGNVYFRGLMSEFIHRKFSQINKYYIEQLKYAFFQNNPIRAGIAGGAAVAPEAKGKGNTKKVLAIYFRDNGVNVSELAQQDLEWGTESYNFSEVLFGGFTATPKAEVNTADDDLRFLQGSVVRFINAYHTGALPIADNYYRDSRTDEPRYIDLQRDITDLEDYDALFFPDFPGEQFGPVKKGRNGDAFDKFIESIKKAVFDDGLNLFITQPHLAQYLGIVSNWEASVPARDSRMIPPNSISEAYIRENTQEAIMNGGDWKAAYNDVFRNPDARLGIESAARKDYADKNYMYYFDTHTNSKHRIAAIIPGITDLKGYTWDEYITWADFQLSWLVQPTDAFRYTDHPNGLKLNDEFKFNAFLSDVYINSNKHPENYQLISYKPEQINVGIALAKQQLYLNNDKELGFGDKLNPERENATVIVVQPGSELDGRVINGRIVINSNDFLLGNNDVILQELENRSWTNAYGWEKETPETLKWNVATQRIPFKMMKINFTSTRVLSRKDGALAVIATEYSRDVAEYGQQVTVRADFTDMSERLWNYVLESEPEVGDGEVRINAAPISASGQAINPAIGVVANANIVAQSAYGVASMGKVAEDESGDASVFAFASTATANMPNIGKTIKAEPMTATGVVVDPVGLIMDTEDIIYFKLASPGSIVLTRNGDSV